MVLLLALSSPVGAAQGDISTFAGGLGEGPGTEISLSPFGIAVSGTSAYVADINWSIIRRLDLANGYITVAAGNGLEGFDGDGGPAVSAELNRPWAVAIDSAGDLLIADTDNHRIRRVDAVTGLITTVAGDGTGALAGDGGPASAAQLNRPSGITVDASDNVLIADSSNHRIRRIDAVTGIITTVAGNGAGFGGDGGPATAAALNLPEGVAVDAAGNLLIADTNNERVRRVDAVTGVITTIAGFGVAGFSGDGGPATAAQLSSPRAVAVDGTGHILIADGLNYRIRRVDTTDGTISTIAGNGAPVYSGDGGPGDDAGLGIVRAVATDTAGNVLIGGVSHQRLRRVNAATQVITTVAGNGLPFFSASAGPAAQVQLRYPTRVAFDSAHNVLIADSGNQRIRRVDAATGVMQTVAGTGQLGLSGDGGPATAAAFSSPYGVAIDGTGNVFIADANNHRVRRVAATTGIITTVAGTTLGYSGDGGAATAAQLYYPNAVAPAADGSVLIADSGNSVIRRVNPTTAIITTIAGNGTPGYSGDGGPATAAQMSEPVGVTLDAAGNFFVADDFAHTVRRVDAVSGIITTVAGTGVAGFSGDGGPAAAAQLNQPWDVAIDATGDLLIADYGNHRIRHVDANTGVITTLAGTGVEGFSGDGGPAAAAQLREPSGVTVDAGGNVLIADSENHRIRRIAGTCGNGTVDAGEECDGDAATPTCCTGVCFIKPAGNVCRVPASSCDLVEMCDGTSGACPPETGLGLSDADADSICDGLDPCTNVAGVQTFADVESKLRLQRINLDTTPQDDKLKLRAAFTLPAGRPFATLDPLGHGARLRVATAAGATKVDAALPPGTFGAGELRGWRTNAGGTRWSYADRTDSLIGGVKKLKIVDKSTQEPGRVAVIVVGLNATYPIVAGDEPLAVTIVVGNQIDAAGGACGESAFSAGDCSFDANQTTLTCAK